MLILRFMNTAPHPSIQQVESAVATALANGHSVTAMLTREGQGQVGPGRTALGALFGTLEFLKVGLKNERGSKLPQTDTFKLVDHWGRLAALSALLEEIEGKTESDGEAARARLETFWRGIGEAALNLTRDIAGHGWLARCVELTDWVMATVRREVAAVEGSIKRMVARG